jgi:hypothetical protein
MAPRSVVAPWPRPRGPRALAAPTLRLRRPGVRLGEGRWTALAAIDEGVPIHVLSAALFDRFESRGASDFADKILSAMRKEFGGHDEKAS